MLAELKKQDTSTDNVIELSVVKGKTNDIKEVRYNKDGSIDKRCNNKESGVSSEVYAFTTDEEIKTMIDLFNSHIEKSKNEHQKQIACRNKMLFLIGINIGLRASDLVRLRYSFFLKDDGEFREFYTLQPKKQRKQGKFVKIYFNETVKKAITDYIEKYPIQDINEYIFKSRKGGSLTERSLWNIMNSSAIEAGIEKNIGSHSLRKTWGYTVWHESIDKSKALVMLQQCFNHSDSMTTMSYIGILDKEKKDMYESVELGLDYL